MKYPFILFFISCSFLPTRAQENEDSKFKLNLGGALRYNYNYSSWKPNQKKRGGDFGFEVFRITTDAVYKDWELHVDQRFYSSAFGGAFLKYGWAQYNINKNSHFKIGLIPAYFGPQQFNSHSWFFQLPFYLGFEDDHDMGISYSYENEKLRFDFGFYKNAEDLTLSDNDPVSTSRYSYDISGRNKEVNQANFRFNYTVGEEAKHIMGTTLQYGGIWNLDTKEMGSHAALGIHYEMDYMRWNLKTQLISYHNRPKNLDGESNDVLEMAAYNFPYNTAARANIYSVGLAYTIPLNKKIIQSVQVYNDYSFMDKAVSTWEDTQMNILGMLISMKHVYIYVDYASGLNQPWLGPDSADALTTGMSDNGWESRFNINIGLYF
ncbi:hypothetical protein [Costertonia aggregata]|uniref:Porin n=1 Tax=Costertonia aggregata TaxID=343403 RepID=A0A7H9AK03_9FLAO|nr:hypothetical protein [Costertonia aggregata]QLG43858.1 hypothetical protein HYG79_00320 [Costertonia aggregata]